jgi:tetratricopeptide (TPR) repeat protein
LLEDGAPEAALDALPALAQVEATATGAHLLEAVALAGHDELRRLHLAQVHEGALDVEDGEVFRALRHLDDGDTPSVPPTPAPRRWLLWARGRRALAHGAVDEALRVAQAMVDEAPQMAASHFLAAEALRAKGLRAEALEATERCLGIAPASAGCLRVAAEMHSDAGECEAAMSFARRLMAARPDAIEGFDVFAASAAYVDPSLEESRRAYELKALRVPREQRDTTLRLDLAALALHRGAVSEAKELLRQPVAENTPAQQARLRALQEDLLSTGSGGANLSDRSCTLDAPLERARRRSREAEARARAHDWPAVCDTIGGLRRQWQGAFPLGIGAVPQRLWEQGHCAVPGSGTPQP